MEQMSSPKYHYGDVVRLRRNDEMCIEHMHPTSGIMLSAQVTDDDLNDRFVIKDISSYRIRKQMNWYETYFYVYPIHNISNPNSRLTFLYAPEDEIEPV